MDFELTMTVSVVVKDPEAFLTFFILLSVSYADFSSSMVRFDRIVFFHV